MIKLRDSAKSCEDSKQSTPQPETLAAEAPQSRSRGGALAPAYRARVPFSIVVVGTHSDDHYVVILLIFVGFADVRQSF